MKVLLLYRRTMATLLRITTKGFPFCRLQDNQALPELPLAVLAKVLQHVPLQQRMQHCALTCRAWCTAADMATTTINRGCLPSKKLQSLSSWLKQHGKQLSSLGVASRWDAALPLPSWHCQLQV